MEHTQHLDPVSEMPVRLPLQVDELTVKQTPIVRNRQADQKCDVAYFVQLIWQWVCTHALPHWFGSNRHADAPALP